jgi:hypothetical protein
MRPNGYIEPGAIGEPLGVQLCFIAAIATLFVIRGEDFTAKTADVGAGGNHWQLNR